MYDDLSNMTYGDFISHRELQRLFVDPPNINDHTTTRDYEEARCEWEFKRLNAFEAARDKLLKEDKKLLVNVKGEGYRIVKPSEQTSSSVDAYAKRVQSATKKCFTELENVQLAMLSDSERAANSMARAKVSSIAGLTRRKALVGR